MKLRTNQLLRLVTLSLAAATSAAYAEGSASSSQFTRILLGTWEYRQQAGAGYDREGEIITFTEVDGIIEGQYFGLEREGEHGLYYTAEKMKNVEIGSDGRVAFTVPGRTLFLKRPKRVSEASERTDSSGFIGDELRFEGSISGERLTLSCKSERPSCPEDQLAFQKGTWVAENERGQAENLKD